VRTWLVVALSAAAIAATSGAARAHTMSDGHLELVADGRRLTGTLDVAVRDLNDAFGLDPGGDGAITWADVTARQQAIARYVERGLTITSDAGPCGIATGALGAIDRPDGSHVAIALTATCPEIPLSVTVDYHLLYELDAQHRGLLHVGEGHAIAKNGDGPVRITVRSGVLARAAAALPGGALGLAIAGAVLALGLALMIVRRTTRLAWLHAAGVAAAVSAPVCWSLYRLVA
jgi:hypothetical protein